MIGSHPGGMALTRRLFALGGITPPGRVLDLGAGGGESVRYLREQGYAAVGIDLLYGAGSSGLFWGDMRSLPVSDGSFDICMAECSVSTCGDGTAALREAFRVLRPGGSLLLSDIFFGKEDAPALSMPYPLEFSCWERVWRETGFTLRKWLDETPVWREFYLESLWNGNADVACLDFFREAGKARCGYFLAWLGKGEDHGTI